METVKRLIQVGKDSYLLSVEHLFETGFSAIREVERNDDLLDEIPEGSHVDFKFLEDGQVRRLQVPYDPDAGYVVPLTVKQTLYTTETKKLTLAYTVRVVNEGIPVVDTEVPADSLYALFKNGEILKLPKDADVKIKEVFKSNLFDLYHMDRNTLELSKVFTHSYNAVKNKEENDNE